MKPRVTSSQPGTMDAGGTAASKATSAPAPVFALSKADAKLLVEIGFLAAGAGDVEHAETIFGALRRLRPGVAYPLLGLAVARMNSGQANEAAASLEKAKLPDAAEQMMLDVWRGLALQLAGRSNESRSLLAEIGRGQGDGARLARCLLGVEEDRFRPASWKKSAVAIKSKGVN